MLSRSFSRTQSISGGGFVKDTLSPVAEGVVSPQKEREEPKREETKREEPKREEEGQEGERDQSHS